MNLNRLKRIFLNSNLSDKNKKVIINIYRKLISTETSDDLWNQKSFGLNSNKKTVNDYLYQVLRLPEKELSSFVPYKINKPNENKKYPKIVAHYLPQFHPFKENDEWWGKGVTEWNNVAKTVPQFVGHYQPRLAGELGYYDLRIVDNIRSQVEIAKNYGIHAFSYYYYWFGGKRLLEKPLDLLIENKDIDIKFHLCWANENWTKRFDGSSTEVLMKVDDTVEGCKAFIRSIHNYISDERYLCINDKPVLSIYRPSNIPNAEEVIKYWREYSKTHYGKDIYLIGIYEGHFKSDLIEIGFDAVSEFHPGSIMSKIKDSTDKMNFIRDDFAGQVYDYSDIVKKNLFEYKTDYLKMYKAVMPMWDNSARRNNRGLIFHGSTPELYYKWLKTVVDYTLRNSDLDDKLIYINAWNEWAEGAYLEPDRKFGYAYLEATWKAIN